MNPENPEQEKYNELSYYTLAHGDPKFIHQYIVDAFAAQHAGKKTKPITIAFALAGLYLHNEKNYSGKEVQKAHIQLAKKKKQWPKFKLPADRGTFTVTDVLLAAPGPDRDRAIHDWSDSVWKIYEDSHAKIADWLKGELGDTEAFGDKNI